MTPDQTAKVAQYDEILRTGAPMPRVLWREVRNILKRRAPDYTQRPDLWGVYGLPIK